MPFMLQVKVPVSGTEAGLSYLRRNGVDFVFVSHPSYMRQGLYSDTKGVYGDNQVSGKAHCQAGRELPDFLIFCIGTNL